MIIKVIKKDDNQNLPPPKTQSGGSLLASRLF